MPADKYQNKSPVMRFFHRYTGFIVVGVSISIIAPWIIYAESQMEFFEKWPCDIINGYLFTGNYDGFPEYDELTEKQKIRFNEILDGCNNEPFTEDQTIPEINHMP